MTDCSFSIEDDNPFVKGETENRFVKSEHNIFRSIETPTLKTMDLPVLDMEYVPGYNMTGQSYDQPVTYCSKDAKHAPPDLL